MREDPVKVDIYLDDDPAPIGSYRPPASFELDTTKLPDGPHKLTIRATGPGGVVGVRVVEFVVRNGPGIAVVGLSSGDIVEGKINVLVNAYAGTTEKEWEPKRAETPAPVPTWAWVLFLAIAAWSMFYWAENLRPDEELANTPTYASSERISQAAGATATLARVAPVEDRATKAGFAWAELGKRVYSDKCVMCHQQNGEGLPRFVPSLRDSPRVAAQSPDEVLHAILTGVPRGINLRSDMPAFARTLSDEEVAAVANFIRTSWGHHAPTVTPKDAKRAREKERLR
jgi:mono/diheme cytochrome c family protein